MRAELGAIAAAFAIVACGDRSPPEHAPPPAAPLTDEAGFLDVPAQAHGSPHRARVFYVFEPADEDADHKPLAVFLAGGPGYPSSLDLLPRGTARVSLDPSAPSAPPAPNPARWTTFANLLFLDERQTGFSYELDEDAQDAGACSFSPLDDAADVVHALLRFLRAHPAIEAAPVMFVGQSYGGQRATLAIDLLLRSETEASRTDASLRGEIQAHYDAIAPRTPIAQFGSVVLLQPQVVGGAQYLQQAALMPDDPYVGSVASDRDPYDVRQPAGWAQTLDQAASDTYADLARAKAIFGVDVNSIANLGPSSRTGAFRVGAADPDPSAITNAAFTAALGALQASDRYLVSPATACPIDDAVVYTGAGSGKEFVANLRAGVRTFISDARYDAVIYSPAIPAALAEVATVTMDTAPRAGVERPGWLEVGFSEADGRAPYEIRFPPYDSSGHFITVGEAQPLHDDVAEWLGR